MARQPRIHKPGGLVHIMARGVGGRDIHHDTGDFIKLKHLIAEAKKKFPFELFSYVFMNNHLHLLLRILEDTAGQIMKQILFPYAEHYYARRRDWKGHLYQGRYKMIHVEHDSYLKELIRYLPLNPVRAGMRTDAADWFWSSHLEYLGESESGILDSEFPLKLFTEDLTEARRRYADFVEAGKEMGHRSDFYPVRAVLRDPCPLWTPKSALSFEDLPTLAGKGV